MEGAKEIVDNRMKKLKALRDKGINPYGGKYVNSSNINELIQNFEEEKEVSVAGRIMAIRTHGKSNFIDIRDSTGKIQGYINRDAVGEEGYVLFENLDIGDIIGLKGKTFRTKTKEPTINVSEITVLSKSIRPLPEKWHGLKDIELRYRQRYLDLLVNKEVKEIFELRSRMISRIRTFLDEKGFLEVETPMMQPLPGGATARPFKTHHEALGIDLYLRIAPELYLKRLLVGGFEKVYEINRNFRNEGTSPRHNPEFTMLEVYKAFANYEDMMELTQELILDVADHLFGKCKVPYRDGEVDLSLPWTKLTFREAVTKYVGVDYREEKDIKQFAKGLGLEVEEARPEEEVVKKIFEKFVEPKLIKPTFIIDYPASLCPLSKRKPDVQDLAERFELFIGGHELANAYSELNDPVEQRARFEEQVEDDVETKAIDEDFVRTLEYGMPPAGGLGIGIDRLAMLFANCDSIKDVILFPQLKPEK
ncbi:MAG: lysyl-tRNA synthetase [Omnitrophica WOR_2 bacterium SM23_29]|nr:MAG: lysyl-tRNA synthetase [Omnitrophica WOR_2 bacterium SM23_29]